MLGMLGLSTQVFKHLPACNLSCMLEHYEYLSILMYICVCVCALEASTHPVLPSSKHQVPSAKCKATESRVKACSVCVHHAEILFVSLRYFCCSLSAQTALYLLYKQFRDFVVYFLSFFLSHSHFHILFGPSFDIHNGWLDSTWQCTCLIAFLWFLWFLT